MVSANQIAAPYLMVAPIPMGSRIQWGLETEGGTNTIQG